MTACREYRFITAAKRAGCDAKQDMGSGSLAVLCPACPQPDMNMDPNWMSRIDTLR